MNNLNVLEQIEKLYPNLFWYSRKKVKSRGLSIELAEDFLQEAIKRFLEGRRNWNPEKVDLSKFLRGIIDSMISHHFEEAYIIKRSNIVDPNDARDPFDRSMKSTESNGQQLLECEDLENYLLNYAKDDEDIQYVLICLFDFKKRSEIAEELDMPVNQVDNILKKIRSATQKYLEENK